jgi:hypothetical protein
MERAAGRRFLIITHLKISYRSQPALNFISRMARLDLSINSKIALRIRAEPDFVIALTLPMERAAVLQQDPAQILFIGRH